MKSTDPNFIRAQKDGEKWMKEHPDVPVVDADTGERRLAKDWAQPTPETCRHCQLPIHQSKLFAWKWLHDGTNQSRCDQRGYMAEPSDSVCACHHAKMYHAPTPEGCTFEVLVGPEDDGVTKVCPCMNYSPVAKWMGL